MGHLSRTDLLKGMCTGADLGFVMGGGGGGTTYVLAPRQTRGVWGHASFDHRLLFICGKESLVHTVCACVESSRNPVG